ncbi:Wzz/FepE/Etk N-terminal domain-containing protein, partial [Micrococcus luteus]
MDQPSANEHSRFTPRDVLRAVRDHWALLASCTLVGILVAALWTLTQPQTYQSQASAVVTAGVNENLG